MSSRSIRAALAIAASIALAVSAAPAATAAERATEHRGTLPGGGTYVLYEPGEWNGTLLTWSPGYGGGGGVATAGPSAEVAQWLTDQGYAVAGAAAGSGWAVEDLLAAQPDVVTLASAVLGDPEHVIAWGSSMGGQVSVALLEQSPDIFDAALPLCGSIAGAIPMLNASLDGTYALKSLLAPDDAALELVNVTDERARQAAFRAHSSKHAQRLAWTAVGDAAVTRVDHNQCALGAARVEKAACKLVPQVFLKLRPC